MNSKIFLISVVLATLLIFSVGVSAKDFDVTDISYSYVGYGYPAYGPATIYGSAYPVGGYIDPYTGMIGYSDYYYPTSYYPDPYYSDYYYPATYYPAYSDYYYPTNYYPTGYYSDYYNYGYGNNYYNNSISYSDDTTSLTFSWMR